MVNVGGPFLGVTDYCMYLYQGKFLNLLQHNHKGLNPFPFGFSP